MGFGKDGKGVIIRESRSQALGTLANGSAILIGTKLGTLERFRMLKAEIYCVVTLVTTGEGSGYIFGLADGDLTLAEIEGAIESSGPLGPNDSITEAISDRPVWFTGMTDKESGVTVPFENETGGHMMTAKPRWTFGRSKSWNWFIYNQGAAPTTGSVASIRCKEFGVWVT